MTDLVWGHWLELALSIGVPFSEFWGLNPKKMKPFLNAYTRRKETEMREKDQMSWMIGAYVMHAIGAAFSDRKHKNYYPQEPIFFKNDPDEVSVDPEQLAEIEVAKFEAFANQYNSTHEFSIEKG